MAGFMNYTKPGKGVSKEDVNKTGIALYFDIFRRRFWNFISINLLYILVSIPAIVISFFIANYLMNAVAGFEGLELNESLSAMMLVLSIPFTVIIFQATGSGPASIAVNKIMDKYIKDTHVWIWSDFVESFKKNFLQGMIMYVINTVAFFACAFAFLFYNYVMEGPMSGVLRAMVIAIALVFFVMQFYAYRIAAMFELKTKHIYRNAFILTFAGLKWNLFGAVVIIAFMCLLYTLLVEIFAAGAVFIIVLYFSLFLFTQGFITNNVVKKYLLEPSLKAQEEKEKEETEEDDD